ncbi:MAG: hypothetical protein M1819_005890 [Sarea resinae]|nr:MAG: hypothetical protein M1819_005890 [Sarea resinae]
MKPSTVLAACVWLAAAAVPAQASKDKSYEFDPACYDEADVLTRDVAVVGGGATGTYAAIKLGDMNQTVVLVEREEILGGHTNTYIDPGTGTPIDYGVSNYQNISVALDFFARFNISVIEFTGGTPSQTVYADFHTGEIFPNTTIPVANYTAYLAQLARFPYLATSWDLPSPVPEDLLLPFGQFIEKYSLQEVAYAVYAHAQGAGDLLNQTTVYVLKAFDALYISGFSGGDITPANHNSHEIYDKALTELGSNALVSSTVLAGQRSTNSSGVKLVVKTPTGNKLIVASKLIVTIPPTLSNMKPFGLDSTEKRVFRDFISRGLYVGLIADTGLPAGFSYDNIGANTTYHVPTLPGLYSVNPTAVEGIFWIWYGSDSILPDAYVQNDTLAAIERLRIAVSNSSTTASNATGRFVAYNSHSPYDVSVSADEIRSGFYNHLDALQGYRNTWYTGGAFLAYHSAPLWNFTQALLPQVIGA